MNGCQPQSVRRLVAKAVHYQTLLALCCLTLSSCRTLPEPRAMQASAAAQRPAVVARPQQPPAAQPFVPVMQNAQIGVPAAVAQVGYAEPVMESAGGALDDCPHCAADSGSSLDQWRPPGLPAPWPADEYICDGGDREQQVHVARNWNVGGIDPEDAVVHYDTLDGHTAVEPTNRVCIYAPRFAVVRQLSGAVLSEQHELLAGIQAPEVPTIERLGLGANAVAQPVQSERHVGVDAPQAFLERDVPVDLQRVQFLVGITYPLLPYEEFTIIRSGQFDASEKARLAEANIAAKTWTSAEGLQVVIDGQAAEEAVRDVLAGEAVVYEMPTGKPRVRIVKIASKQNALPGEIVHFTLRFDNVGDQVVGNVTILDNLTPRLEYIADSAKSTVDADFFTVEQEGTSLVLRWELKTPLKVGEGGTIRFDAKVR